jgi:hypothetical protein
MTPRERVEAVACAAWCVSRIVVSVHPDASGCYAFATVPRDSPCWLSVGCQSESARGVDEADALRRLEHLITSECRGAAKRYRLLADAAVARAQHAERIAACLDQALRSMTEEQ